MIFKIFSSSQKLILIQLHTVEIRIQQFFECTIQFKFFSKRILKNLIHSKTRISVKYLIVFFQTWFQNRRIKDRKNGIAVERNKY